MVGPARARIAAAFGPILERSATGSFGTLWPRAGPSRRTLQRYDCMTPCVDEFFLRGDHLPGAGGEAATNQPRERRKTALLAMDLQCDFLRPQGRLPIAPQQIEGVIAAMNEALQGATRQRLEIIYITNAFARLDPLNILRNRAAIGNSAGAMLDPRVLQVTPSAHFNKRRRDAFSNKKLIVHLAARGVKDLLISGVHADACVAATARTAFRRGFKVTVLTDAVGAISDVRRERACANLASLGARLATVRGALIYQ